MKITKEILGAIERGKAKIKGIEAGFMPEIFRKDSAWLEAINDIINRTGLAIRDELEHIETIESKIEQQVCPECKALDALEWVKREQFYFCSECGQSFEKEEIDGTE